MLNPSDIKVGSILVYDDGRDGHRNVKGIVQDFATYGMLVQFEDRVSANFILFSDDSWMNYLSLTHNS